jgi:hypothetical protein
MSQTSSKVPPKDSVNPLCPIQMIIFDDSNINEAILSEDNIRYHVCFASHICLKNLSGFRSCNRLFRIEIPASVEVIYRNAFFGCHSLTEVIFPANSRLKILDGFHYCSGFFRIEIPASVEIINPEAFMGCNSLRELIFAADSHLKIIAGFLACFQLFRIEIPASVEVIDLVAFFGCNSLHAVVFPPDSRVREIHGFLNCESLSRIEIESGSPIRFLPFFRQHQKCLVFRKMSKEWSILFEVDCGCYLINEPLTDIFENAERLRERNVLNVDNKMMKISKISDRLFCLYVLQSIEIPSFIQSIGSCMRLMKMKIEILIIPSFSEKIDGFYGFVSIEVVRFGVRSCIREIRGFFCCESLRRIEIPASAEIVSGFHLCDSLTEVLFESDSRIREIRGFYS